MASGEGADRILGAALPIALGQDGTPPQWVTLIPAGTFTLNDGRGTFHNTWPGGVIDNTKAWLGGRDAAADYDHLSELVQETGREAIAAGWIKDWRVSADGAIEAKVDWTPTAQQRIRDKEYRYLSPVFAADKKTSQVTQLFGFALTNRPAINELPAIAAAHRSTEESNVLNKLIAQVLGLPETSTDADLVAAVTNAKKNFDGVVIAASAKPSDSVDVIVAAIRATPDAAKWIAASEHQKLTGQLQVVIVERDELRKKLAGDETETVIAAAIKDGKLVPAQNDYWTKVCATAGSAEPLREYLKTAVVVVKPGAEDGSHRPAPGTETVITAAMLNAAEKAHCAKNGLKEESYARELTKIIVAGGSRPLAAAA